MLILKLNYDFVKFSLNKFNNLTEYTFSLKN